MKRFRLCRRSTRRGAVAVEFAFAAPVFFLLLFGAIEIGRLNIVRHVVDNAAYEAARHGLVPGGTAAEITAQGNVFLANAGISGGTVTVTPTTVDEDTEQITVTVRVSMSTNAWMIPAQFTGGAFVEGSSTLRTERYRGIL